MPTNESAVVRAFDELAFRHDAAQWAPEQGAFDDAVHSFLGAWAESTESARDALFLGCGSGREALPFLTDDWRCVLLDASEQMLSLCRSRLAVHPRAEFVHSTAERYLAATTEQFTLISMVGELMGYVADVPRLLSGVRRSLRASSSLVFTWVDAEAVLAAAELRAVDDGHGGVRVVERDEPPLTIAAFTEEQLLELLRDSGFAVTVEIGRGLSRYRRCWTCRTWPGPTPEEIP